MTMVLRGKFLVYKLNRNSFIVGFGLLFGLIGVHSKGGYFTGIFHMFIVLG
jgi:hypothetical protein